MLRVKKDNKEFRIRDDELSDYLTKGFDLIDERGQVVTLGTKERSVEDIARENKELRRRNRQLEEGVRQRDETIANLRAEAGQTPTSAPEVSEDNAGSEQASLFDASASESTASAPEANQHVCPTCGKVCASAPGLAKHRKTHE